MRRCAAVRELHRERGEGLRRPSREGPSRNVTSSAYSPMQAKRAERTPSSRAATISGGWAAFIRSARLTDHSSSIVWAIQARSRSLQTRSSTQPIRALRAHPGAFDVKRSAKILQACDDTMETVRGDAGFPTPFALFCPSRSNFLFFVSFSCLSPHE